MNEKLQKHLSDVENMIGIQRNCVTGPGKDYMHGLLNGLILAHSVFSESSPKYYTIPRKGGRKVRHKCRK